MNRAQRRSLKRVVAKAVKGIKPDLKHPVPDSVALSGGPMDGWIVKPDAPALEPDWRAKYLEAMAIELFMLTLFGTASDPRWSDLSAEEQQPWIDQAKAQHGAGRYDLSPGGKTAAWVAE